MGRWYEMIGEPISADAIPDRIIPNARRIELKEDSMAQESTKPELTQTEDPEIIPQTNDSSARTSHCPSVRDSLKRLSAAW